MKKANDTTFQPGHVRSNESIRKQRETISRLVEQGEWISQKSREKNRGPHPERGQPKEKHPRWMPIGSRRLLTSGYVQIKIDATSTRWSYEHRVVAEKKYGRPIERGEHVHHLNGIKSDNRPENLVILSGSEHAHVTHAGRGRPPGLPRCSVCKYRHPPHG